MIVEIVIAIFLAAGFVAYILFLRKMSGPSEKSKVKQKKRGKRKTKKKDETEIPEAWLKEKDSNPKRESSFSQVGGRRKIQVPGLRLAKRVLAVVLLVANFFIMCATLIGATATQPMFWLFFLNFFMLADYLWKTGRREI